MEDINKPLGKVLSTPQFDYDVEHLGMTSQLGGITFEGDGDSSAKATDNLNHLYKIDENPLGKLPDFWDNDEDETFDAAAILEQQEEDLFKVDFEHANFENISFPVNFPDDINSTDNAAEEVETDSSVEDIFKGTSRVNIEDLF